jgi:hypothetical protein
MISDRFQYSFQTRSSSMRRIIGLLSLFCVLLAIAGCGGSDEPPKAELPAVDREKNAKEMEEGIAKQRQEAETGAAARRPGGR